MWDCCCSTVCVRVHPCCLKSRPLCPVTPLLVLPLSVGVCGQASVGVHSEEWPRSAVRPAAGARPAEHRDASLLVSRPHLGAQLPHGDTPPWCHPHHGLPKDPTPAQLAWKVHRRGRTEFSSQKYPRLLNQRSRLASVEPQQFWFVVFCLLRFLVVDYCL